MLFWNHSTAARPRTTTLRWSNSPRCECICPLTRGPPVPDRDHSLTYPDKPLQISSLSAMLEVWRLAHSLDCLESNLSRQAYH